MSKIAKICFIFILIFSIYLCHSNAETTNLYNDIVNENTSNTSASSNETTSNTSSNTTTNETVTNETTNTTSTDDDIDLFDDTEDDTNTTTNTASSSNTSNSAFNANAARVNTVASISEANLGLNNILCIVLIAIGVLIILPAIAILIRLKK